MSRSIGSLPFVEPGESRGMKCSGGLSPSGHADDAAAVQHEVGVERYGGPARVGAEHGARAARLQRRGWRWLSAAVLPLASTA